ncbi:hypothetical protein GJAV_G00144260 [Gymnothorax javanicus]|nr:hypothetical protein GJAV_G00144260 [Gymnothorax javanicus]
MDEAEKYQQRLQAIAEKRRLQDEEDRAKREMEDQRLRVEQLKRKSLRDQWLMEAPPTSPGSPTPDSPVFSSPTEETEPQTDQQSESPKVVEETDQQDDGKTSEVREDGTSAEKPAPPARLENGQKDPSESSDPNPAVSTTPESAEDGVDSGLAPSNNGIKNLQAAGEPMAQPTPEEAGPEVEKGEVIPNGTEEGKEEPGTNSASEPSNHEGAASPGPQETAEEGGTEGKPGEEPGKDAEDGDAGKILRAERVMVTEDGDEPADGESLGPEAEAKESTPEAETAATPSDGTAPASDKAPVQEEPKPDASNSTEDLQNPDKEPQEGAPKLGEVAEAGAGGNAGEAPAEHPADSSETDLVASQVPVYPTELPAVAPQPKAEGEDAEPEETEKVPAPAVAAGRFQDIPLDGNSKPEAAKESEPQPSAAVRSDAQAEPSEQQALLDPSKAVPNRAEGAGTPKRKTCQCCSVM